MRINSGSAVLFAVGYAGWVFLCNGEVVVPAAMAQSAAGIQGTQSPPAQEGDQETDELPKVDVEIVPGRRWKTSRRALIKMKQQFKQFIHDEISKVAHEYDQQLNAVTHPPDQARHVRRSPLDVYEQLLGTPPEITHPLLKATTQQRFQAVQEHDMHTTAAPLDANVSLEGLSNLLESNAVGGALDMQQDATGNKYLKALVQGIEQ
uniref:Putative transmembrane protein n=1 Tax=Toxoplasma gondii TgCATBr9 TaxID=943120 RepID=A0A2T6ISL0_TOXGO|nr:putative transmembrane protein [Toxoplasma gondii TgCATBr9]